MVIFTCPSCGQERTGARRRCYVCTKTVLDEAARTRIAEKLIGVSHSDERRRRNSEARRAQLAAGQANFDLAALVRGKPSPRAKPVGTTRVQNGHIEIKCPDGQWRYRARVMWAEANGPIPAGHLVHHVNEDPFDDRLDNFELVTRAEHGRRHVPPGSGRAKAMNIAGRIARYGH